MGQKQTMTRSPTGTDPKADSRPTAPVPPAATSRLPEGGTGPTRRRAVGWEELIQADAVGSARALAAYCTDGAAYDPL